MALLLVVTLSGPDTILFKHLIFLACQKLKINAVQFKMVLYASSHVSSCERFIYNDIPVIDDIPDIPVFLILLTPLKSF